VERVIELFERSVERYAGVPATRGAKAVVTLQVEQHGELWAQAINDAFRILGKDVQATIQPVMQSVADDVLDKTTTLLTGDKPSVISKRVMQQSVNEIARDVTGINKTTQGRLARLISKSIDEGQSPGEVMEAVRRKIPQIATNRVPTIVRTEMGRIADRAAIRSMKDSAVVTHVSVSGCEAIEQGIPTFRGTPTCNIKNVPIEYAGDLQFHINHTGAITASGFRQENGNTPSLPLKGGEGIGTWEDRGRPVPAFVSDGGPPKPTQPPTPPAAPITPTPLPPTPPLAPAAPMVPVKPKPLPKPKPVVAPKPTPTPAPIPAVVDPAPVIAPTPVSSPIIPEPSPATPSKPARLPGIPDNQKFDRLNEFMSSFMSDEHAYRAQLAGMADWENVFDANIDKGSYLMQVARTFSDEKPTFLSRQEFLDKSKDVHPLGHFDRGVIHKNPLKELKKDKAWQGSGMFGDGYYHQLCRVDKITVSDSLNGRVTQTARDYAGRSDEARVMTGFLGKEAKVITHGEISLIRRDLLDYLNKLPLDTNKDFAEAYYGVAHWTDLTEDMIKAVEGEYKALTKMFYYAEEVAMDRGALARLLDYDAIHVDSSGRDFLVVVNNRHYNLLDAVAKRKNVLDNVFSFPD
jgi:hypothetical protein